MLTWLQPHRTGYPLSSNTALTTREGLMNGLESEFGSIPCITSFLFTGLLHSSHHCWAQFWVSSGSHHIMSAAFWGSPQGLFYLFFTPLYCSGSSLNTVMLSIALWFWEWVEERHLTLVNVSFYCHSLVTRGCWPYSGSNFYPTRVINVMGVISKYSWRVYTWELIEKSLNNSHCCGACR
jgi:hypothetical protein